MRRRIALFLAATLVTAAGVDCAAIEMFTYYGDGSRIGLPSLEVPVEAYPGIPLRSDRIRMRRRAARGGATRGGAAAAQNTITLREMQTAPAAQPAVPVAPEPQ